MPTIYQASLRHAVYYLLLLRDLSQVFDENAELIPDALEAFDYEWPNFQAGYDWSLSISETDNEAAAICSSYPGCGAYLLDLRQHPRERIKWIEEGIRLARQLKDRSLEGHLLNCLAIPLQA